AAEPDPAAVGRQLCPARPVPMALTLASQAANVVRQKRGAGVATPSPAYPARRVLVGLPGAGTAGRGGFFVDGGAGRAADAEKNGPASPPSPPPSPRRSRSLGAADKEAAEELRCVGEEGGGILPRQAVEDADPRPHPRTPRRGAGAGPQDDILPAVAVEVHQADPHAAGAARCEGRKRAQRRPGGPVPCGHPGRATLPLPDDQIRPPVA